MEFAPAHRRVHSSPRAPGRMKPEPGRTRPRCPACVFKLAAILVVLIAAISRRCRARSDHSVLGM
jgi:hypothetical protein